MTFDRNPEFFYFKNGKTVDKEFSLPVRREQKIIQCLSSIFVLAD